MIVDDRRRITTEWNHHFDKHLVDSIFQRKDKIDEFSLKHWVNKMFIGVVSLIFHEVVCWKRILNNGFWTFHSVVISAARQIATFSDLSYWTQHNLKVLVIQIFQYPDILRKVSDVRISDSQRFISKGPWVLDIAVFFCIAQWPVVESSISLIENCCSLIELLGIDSNTVNF